MMVNSRKVLLIAMLLIMLLMLNGCSGFTVRREMGLP